MNPSGLALLLLSNSSGLMQSPSSTLPPPPTGVSPLLSTSLSPSTPFQKILNLPQSFYTSPKKKVLSLSLIQQAGLIGCKLFQNLFQNLATLFFQIFEAKPIGLSLFTIIYGLNSCYSLRPFASLLTIFASQLHDADIPSPI